MAAQINGQSLPLIETVKTQQVRDVRWSEKYKDDGSSISGQSKG